MTPEERMEALSGLLAQVLRATELKDLAAATAPAEAALEHVAALERTDLWVSPGVAGHLGEYAQHVLDLSSGLAAWAPLRVPLAQVAARLRRLGGS